MNVVDNSYNSHIRRQAALSITTTTKKPCFISHSICRTVYPFECALRPLALPPLRPAGSAHRPAANAAMPTSSSSRVTADYTYSTPLRAYTVAHKQRSSTSGLTTSGVHDSAAMQEGEDGQRGSSAPQPLEEGSATPPQYYTAAVFQAKLRRALWLDQRTSCAHEERSERAVLRCAEAEARDALWWPCQRERTAFSILEDYTQRTAVHGSHQVRQHVDRQRAQVADLVDGAEPEARRAVELAATTAFLLLCGAESTEAVRLSALVLAKEKERAEVLARTAQLVRQSELELARTSYYEAPAFDPFVDDLSSIAEGLSVRPTHRATPLEEWRRKYTTAPAGAAPATAATAAAGPVLGQGTVKVMELYARRNLRYEEEKSRLMLEWWKGLGTIQHVDEAQARCVLWCLHAAVTSPARMRAVAVLQRWCRILYAGPWSQHRRQVLSQSLSQMPHWHSTDRYKRRLQKLESPVRQWDGTEEAAATVRKRLECLATAATHPRRYAMELSLYFRTLKAKVRAFLAGMKRQSLIWLPSVVACVEEEEGLDSDDHAATSLRMMRQTRWLPSNLPPEVPASHRACLSLEHSSAEAPGRELQAAQAVLSEELTRGRLRVERQEEHERHVRMLASSRPTPAPAIHGCSDTNTTESSQHSSVVAPAAVTDEGLVKARHCVQQACDVLASLPTYSTYTTPTVDTTAAVGDAVRRYGDAFDSAAASVYVEQYTAVHERFAALNAGLLVAIQDALQCVLNGKAALEAEESAARSILMFGHPSGQRIAQLQLVAAEERQRAWLVSAEDYATLTAADSAEGERRLLELVP